MILDIVFALSLASAAYIFIRNFMVRLFLAEVFDAADRHEVDFIGRVPLSQGWKHRLQIDRIVSDIYSISYVRVLFSFKALTVENWFTPEQVSFIRGESYRPEDYIPATPETDTTTEQ